jgi:2-methylaconitate cis-trans-isomerase PrpF
MTRHNGEAKPMTVPASFMRGGTSKGLFFLEQDLPAGQHERDGFLLSAMGSPDGYRRQLNGMGGGISSLSKIIIARKSNDPEADVEYLHGQVHVDQAKIDYSANCGNLSSAVAQFAALKGLVAIPNGGTATVRLKSLNSGAYVDSRFPVEDGKPVFHGQAVMPGVGGSGASVELRYLAPDTPLFPSGAAVDALELSDRVVEASLPNATLSCVFVSAEALGLSQSIDPASLDADAEAMRALETLRRAGAVRMGLAADADAVASASPKIGIIGRPCDYVALDSKLIPAGSYDLAVRMISMGNAHKAVPLTAGMCLAACALTPTSVARQLAPTLSGPAVRLGTPSGVLTVGAELDESSPFPKAKVTSVFATSRLLMTGQVHGIA